MLSWTVEYQSCDHDTHMALQLVGHALPYHMMSHGRIYSFVATYAFDIHITHATRASCLQYHVICPARQQCRLTRYLVTQRHALSAQRQS